MKTKTDVHVNKIPLFSSKGKKLNSMELNKDVFNGKSNNALLYQLLRMYNANKRKGTASTKTRGEVRGSGKKPWRQKGTGRARVGSKRNPVWRGGGIAFGPHPRDFRYSVPKKMKRKAFISSLNAKLKAGKVVAIEDLVLENPKTKNVSGLLKSLNITAKVLLLVQKIDKNLLLASRNVEKLTLKKIAEATALDVLSNDRVIMTKPVAESLERS
ncbi:MAG: 50S ribosomal protein L4 [Candidatus Omnitrophica bacterium]|nr:50S ribosomal protein L4 [Candidatus Omnitrophota bacterium]